MTTTFKIRGVNGDLDTCQCCGKTGLKKVVWLDRLEDGEAVETVAYGVNCARKAMNTSMGQVALWSLAQQKQREAETAERCRVHEIGTERSVKKIVIEEVGCNGGSLTVLGYANGLMSVVKVWAETQWPHRELLVRWAR